MIKQEIEIKNKQTKKQTTDGVLLINIFVADTLYIRVFIIHFKIQYMAPTLT